MYILPVINGLLLFFTALLDITFMARSTALWACTTQSVISDVSSSPESELPTSRNVFKALFLSSGLSNDFCRARHFFDTSDLFALLKSCWLIFIRLMCADKGVVIDAVNKLFCMLSVGFFDFGITSLEDFCAEVLQLLVRFWNQNAVNLIQFPPWAVMILTYKKPQLASFFFWKGRV